MTVKLAPDSRRQYLDSSGNPYAGAKLFYYAADTATKQATYTTSEGTVENSNPIILDASGRTPYGVWLTSGVNYKEVLAPSTDTDPPTSPIFTEDYITGINDTAAVSSQWTASGSTPTYVSGTQFTVPGDASSTFPINRRIKASVTAGTVYGYISAVAVASQTTVTVVIDSGALDSGLSAVEVGILTDLNGGIPQNVAKKNIANTFTGAITMSGVSLIEAEGAAVTAASSTNIWANDGNTIHVTGNTTINNFGTAPQAGAWKKIIFDGTPTLTQSANLNLNAGGSNIIINADDIAFVYADTTTQMDVFVMRKNGNPITTLTSTLLLSVITPTAAANVDALNTFSSSYDNYLIIGDGIKPNADDSLCMRFANAGTTDTGSNYAITNVNSSSAAAITSITPINPSVGSSTGKGMNFSFEIKNANDSTNLKSASITSQIDSTGTYAAKAVGGFYFAASAISGFRLFWSGGATFLAQGKIYIFAYKNS